MLAGLSSAVPVELIGDTDTILGLGMRTGPLLCDLLRDPPQFANRVARHRHTRVVHDLVPGLKQQCRSSRPPGRPESATWLLSLSTGTMKITA